jgi:hypothetical protein
MAKAVKFDTSFNFGANTTGKAKKPRKSAPRSKSSSGKGKGGGGGS